MKYNLFFIISLIFFKGIAQNDFDNGNSPSVFRYFHEYKSIPEYNQFIFYVEEMDVINYFGSRLKDLNNDGKIDVIYRAKEKLEGDWDFASFEPRPFIHLNIDNNFEGQLIKDTQHLFTGPDVFYHENENGEKLYYNYSDMDPSYADQSGVDDFRQYLEKYNFIEERDYKVYDEDGRDVIEWIPRIIKISENTRIDVTHEYLESDDELQNSYQQFPWDYVVGTGDYDGDGDKDILMIGKSTTLGDPNINNYDSQYSNMNFYFMENQGNGKLISSIYSFIPDNGAMWTVEHTNILLASNFDADTNDELLLELKYNISDIKESRQLGYLNINKQNKSVDFVSLLKGNEYLNNPEWNIAPRHYKSVSYDSYPDREFIMTLVTSPNGSPPVINSEPRAIPSFNDGISQQYFKVFEKVFDESNNVELVDRTLLFFGVQDNKTLSMDNSGGYHFIDMDNDGDLDIFPQLHQGPNDYVGGINQFLNYPNWCGDPNSICFFKNVGDRYELGTLKSLKGLFPNNFDFTSDYNLFDNLGAINDERGSLIEDFFIGNKLSINDINNDGEYEYLTASNPDFLTIFTKSNVAPNPEIFNLNLDYQAVIIQDYTKLTYNHEGNNFYLPKDTINLKYEANYNLRFFINDNEQLLSHKPKNIDIINPESVYTATPRGGKNKSGELLNSPKSIYEIDFMNDPNHLDKFTSISKPILLLNFRKGNDIYMKQFPVSIVNENINPFPFELISIDSSDPSLLSLSFNTSFDYNKNYHQRNSNYNVSFKGTALAIEDNIPGPKYGYRIIQNGTTTEVVNDVSYEINYRRPEPGSENHYVIDNFKIDVSEYQNTEFEYEVFAVDTEDASLTTLMKKSKFTDSDSDGIIDFDDDFPLDPYSSSSDENGNPIFYLPSNNFNVGVVGASCIDQNNGKIDIILVDQSKNYTASLDGNESIEFNSTTGYSQSFENLSTGVHQVCFSVDVDANFNRCFSLNVTEPDALSVYSRVSSSKKSVTINMEGSNRYTVKLNGKISVIDSNSSELELKTGVNFLEVYTDKECQGVYTKEIFVSEEVQYYPNPTRGALQVFVSGEDTKINISISGVGGYCYSDQLRSVSSSRKIDVDLSSFNKGVYIIQIQGPTVSKSFKIIKN